MSDKITKSEKLLCNGVSKNNSNIFLSIYIYITLHILTLIFNGLIFHPDSRETPLSGISSDISSPVKVTFNLEISEASLGQHFFKLYISNTSINCNCNMQIYFRVEESKHTLIEISRSYIMMRSMFQVVVVLGT